LQAFPYIVTRILDFSEMEYIRVMKTREITEKLGDWQKKATETARNVGETTDKYVHEYTWASIACAAVVGCLVGYLLANGRRD
jgi:ElaB/YqjD/DUF883 family membrane-anchored ribosome-binding protein